MFKLHPILKINTITNRGEKVTHVSVRQNVSYVLAVAERCASSPAKAGGLVHLRDLERFAVQHHQLATAALRPVIHVTLEKDKNKSTLH